MCVMCVCEDCVCCVKERKNVCCVGVHVSVACVLVSQCVRMCELMCV